MTLLHGPLCGFITGEKDKELYDEAMKRGYVESALPLVLFVGVTGSGKTLFKQLLLGQSVPKFSPATPLTEPAVRTTGNEEWKVVGPKEMMDMVADAVKGEVLLLDSTWQESSHMAFTGPQEHSEHPKPIPKTSHELTSKAVASFELQVSMPQQITTKSDKKIIQDAVRKIHIDSTLLERMKNPPNDIVGKLMNADFLYLLDSGGQPPFREMLPHFVQKTAAIVLMFKLNERLDFKPTITYREKEEKEDKGYKSELTNKQILHLYIQAVQSHNSRVFIVGTHMDREKESEDQGETRKDKNDKLKEDFSTVLCGKMELYGNQLIFPVDCTKRDSHSDSIAKQFRSRVIRNCTGEKVKIPLSFFMLDQLLKLLKINVLSIEECLQAAEQKLLMPRNLCESALKHLGKLNIIFYRPNILSKVVFPDPKVILTMITELVRCSHELRTNGSDDSTMSNDDLAATIPPCMQTSNFEDFALVNEQLLQEAFHSPKAFPSPYREGVFNAANFLELLKGLLIAGRLDNDGNHFIPSLLPDLPNEGVKENRVTSSNNPAPLVIYYPNMWLPVGVMPSLVVHLRNDFKWVISSKHGKPSCLYHNCIKFKLPGGRPGSVVLIDSTKFLEIHVKSTAAKVDSKLCRTIREDIMAGLEEAHKSLHYDPPKVEIGFLCSGVCGNTDEPHLAMLDDERSTWTCSEDDNEGKALTPTECIWLEEPKVTSTG